MYKNLFLVTSLALLLGCGAAKSIATGTENPVRVKIDLLNSVNDQVMVQVDPGPFAEKEVLFLIPKTVPGTYSEDDFGQYIEDLVALDYKGNPLETERRDNNTWLIKDGRNLDMVRYAVNDTFDSETEVEDPVFSPAGTNILAGENYLLNLHGFVGYFKGYTEVPYELEIQSPPSLEPTTSLKRMNGSQASNSQNLFRAKRYFEVIDNPIMYAKPNSVTFRLSDIEVTLSVYSPNGTYSAKDLHPKMETMMRAQKEFLGSLSGTQTYTILLYLSQANETDAMGFGALEHHTSTVLILPEMLPRPALEEAMVDVVSHEFFHTLTPLSVHSREIQFFDYNEPEMSMHLWMYEGTTEYFANLFQVQKGLITDGDFLDRMAEKISNSKAFDDTMSFTVMSKNVLESPYKENYQNVYEKGTLINMCLDILLREKSRGEKSMRWLMVQLASKYNENTPFNDPELIGEITAMTYPEVGEFFSRHVQGDQPIPYEDYLLKTGLKVEQGEVPASYFFRGQIPYIDADPSDMDTIFIQKGMELNSFLKGLGAKGGDVILEINGVPITLDSMRAIVGESFSWDSKKDILMSVMRDGEKFELSGKAGIPTYTERKISEMEGVTEEALELRKSWLHP
ncbi:Predicted metalloprotease, contains C-terminal PDZ domain [Muriicola jejuensis]|uniref:Peptidase M61 n=1 Tax=Muriicola jejuensis TaxID=504488 RepID=A0A6P0UCC8_9FLAO|nr:peptidase M61 [Muriicola jejuensis]NER09539.1 peptidase M61 [Muriicola jejuensis]SMP07964.1 Predicted metalloprotease, contains C-terminal PDZ domain [Muriicola jejuensis]